MIIKYNHWEIVHWLVSTDQWYGENLQGKIKSNNFKSLDRHFHAITFSLWSIEKSTIKTKKKKKHFKPQIFVPSTFLSTHKFTIKSPPTSWPIVNPPNMFLRVSLRFRVQATRDHRDVCSSFFPSFFLLLVFYHPPPGGWPRINKIPRTPQHRRKSVSRAWKMAENLIFRIKNIEIQNQFLPWSSGAGGRVEKSLRVSFTLRATTRTDPHSPRATLSNPLQSSLLFQDIIFKPPRGRNLTQPRRLNFEFNRRTRFLSRFHEIKGAPKIDSRPTSIRGSNTR